MLGITLGILLIVANVMLTAYVGTVVGIEIYKEIRASRK